MLESGEEKYSRGWRGAPAKGVGRETGARVQIPLSPLRRSAIRTPKVNFRDDREVNFFFLKQLLHPQGNARRNSTGSEKKIFKISWKSTCIWKKEVILYHLPSRKGRALEKGNRKVLKNFKISAWQSRQSEIWYQSCRWESLKQSGTDGLPDRRP